MDPGILPLRLHTLNQSAKNTVTLVFYSPFETRPDYQVVDGEGSDFPHLGCYSDRRTPVSSTPTHAVWQH